MIAESIRDAVKRMKRRPGLTIGIVATLMLGIGANAALFDVVDRLLLQPPRHIDDPASVRLIYRHEFFIGQMRHGAAMSHPMKEHLQEIAQFRSVALSTRRTMQWGEGAEARPLEAGLAEASLFTQLGVRAHRGRFFNKQDDQLTSPLVAVLSYPFWLEHFGRSSSAIGRTLILEGHSFEIIGVAPRGFSGLTLNPVDVWLPFYPSAGPLEYEDTLASNRRSWLIFSARLKEGASIKAAEEEATALYRSIKPRRRETDPDPYITLESLIEAERANAPAYSRITIWLSGVSLILLGIACANVANLLLVQGLRARRETALRMALGMGRLRLAVRWLTESSMLAVLGGAASLALAVWASQFLRSMVAERVDWSVSVLNTRLLLFCLVLSLAAGLGVGLFPFLQSRQRSLVEDLKSGGPGGGADKSRLRTILVSAQTALTAMLLIGTGLFVASLLRVESLDMGFEDDGLYLVHPRFEEKLEEAESSSFTRDGLERLERLPGVQAAAAASGAPFYSSRSATIRIPGREVPESTTGGPYVVGVTGDYFETLAVSILRGRPLTPEDDISGRSVTVLGQTMARMIWAGEDPLGQCIYLRDSEQCTAIVGIAEDSHRGELVEEDTLQFYMPASLLKSPPDIFLLRAAPAADRQQWKAALLQMHPRVRQVDVHTVSELISPFKSRWRRGAGLFSIFGLLALLVSAVGLYSMQAFEVASRRREMGIRAALGAAASRLMGHVLGGALRLVAVSLLLGLGMAALAASSLQGLLFETSPYDPAVYAAVGVALLLVSIAASIVPSLRAARVDPAETLRAE